MWFDDISSILLSASIHFHGKRKGLLYIFIRFGLLFTCYKDEMGRVLGSFLLKTNLLKWKVLKRQTVNCIIKTHWRFAP